MSEITRRWEEALTDLAEHYDRAMTRQAEQNAQLQRQVKALLAEVKSLRRQVEQRRRDDASLKRQADALQKQVTSLGRDYAGLASALRERSS